MTVIHKVEIYNQEMLVRIEKQNRAHRQILIAMIMLLMSMVWGTSSLLGQEFENLDGSYKDKEPAYYVKLSLEYMDNERDTEESGYLDLNQKQVQKEGHGSVKLYFFNLDAHYKAYDSEIRVGADKTGVSGVRDTVSARAEFLDYLYLFAQWRGLDREYSHFDDGSLNFFENEKATAYLQGFGLVLGDWRFGLSPITSYSWSYKVKIAQQTIIDENIEFETNVLEFAKKATDTQGPFYELGFKKWRDTGIKDGRSGSLDRDEAYVMLGMGFSENTHIYLGGKNSQGKITSIIESDNSEATRKSHYTNNVLGFRIGIGEESSVYVEQRFMNRKIEFTNHAYENTHRYQEEKLTIGTELNDRLSLELKFGKTRIEKNYTSDIVTYESYRYRQVDNLIGVSVNMRFSESRGGDESAQ